VRTVAGKQDEASTARDTKEDKISENRSSEKTAKTGRARKSNGAKTEKPAETESTAKTHETSKVPVAEADGDVSHVEPADLDEGSDEIQSTSKPAIEANQDTIIVGQAFLQAPNVMTDSETLPPAFGADVEKETARQMNDDPRFARPTAKAMDSSLLVQNGGVENSIPEGAKSEESVISVQSFQENNQINNDLVEGEASFEQMVEKFAASEDEVSSQKIPTTQPQLSPSVSMNQAGHSQQPSIAANFTTADLTRPLTAFSESQFADVNHPKIVTAVRSELFPNGGTLRIRLDPPELGAMQVQVDMRDGVVTASFQTSNDDATRLLTHSLGRLRDSLESQGVSVEKLNVSQAPREHFQSNNGHDGSHRHAQDQSAQQQEQQRREMLQRMWRRLRFGADPLDLVA
jgi:flagellar hook-length control protein FliK